MTLRGIPFLVRKSIVYRDVLGIDRKQFRVNVRDGVYPLFEWVRVGKAMKVTRPSLEKQLESMRVVKEDKCSGS